MAAKILIGYTESPEGDDALALGRLLGATYGAELLVAAVLEHSPFPIESRAYDRAIGEHFARLFAGVTRGLGSDAFEERRLAHSSPAQALSELAEAEGVDAIVLGSTHRGPIGRVHPGSVAERLLSGGPCAVAVAPRAYAERAHYALRRIGVAFDGRPDAWVALHTACGLVREGAILRVITVVPPLDMTLPFAAGTEAALAARREQFAAVLDGALATARASVACEGRLLEGDPTEVLAAQSVDLDALIVGSRGYGPLRRVFLGGVSTVLARNSAAPLLVVPRGASAIEDPAAHAPRPPG